MSNTIWVTRHMGDKYSATIIELTCLTLQMGRVASKSPINPNVVLKKINRIIPGGVQNICPPCRNQKGKTCQCTNSKFTSAYLAPFRKLPKLCCLFAPPLTNFGRKPFTKFARNGGNKHHRLRKMFNMGDSKIFSEHHLQIQVKSITG